MEDPDLPRIFEFQRNVLQLQTSRPQRLKPSQRLFWQSAQDASQHLLDIDRPLLTRALGRLGLNITLKLRMRSEQAHIREFAGYDQRDEHVRTTA